MTEDGIFYVSGDKPYLEFFPLDQRMFMVPALWPLCKDRGFLELVIYDI